MPEQRNGDIQSDTPEDLLNGTGKSLGGVASLSSSETNKLSSSVRKGSRDEDGTETSETVLEGARIPPELTTLIRVEFAVIGASTADEDDGDDHEDDNGSELEA